MTNKSKTTIQNVNTLHCNHTQYILKGYTEILPVLIILKLQQSQNNNIINKKKHN